MNDLHKKKQHIASQKALSRKRSVHLASVFITLSAVFVAIVVSWPHIVRFFAETDDAAALNAFEQNVITAQSKALSRVKPSEVHGAKFFHSGPDKTLITIKSERVARPEDDGSVHLEHVSGSAQLTDGSSVFITADKGEVVPDTAGHFSLEGSVNIMQEQGHELLTEMANIDFPSQKIVVPNQIDIISPMGKMKGESGVIDYKNHTLAMAGKSKIIFNREKGSGH